MSHLHHLLRFSNRLPSQAENIDDMLIQCLNLQQSGLPYARAMHPGSGSTILFRPIHLKAGLNNAIVYPIAINQDITQLINDLGNYFKVDCDIKELPGQAWMMHLHQLLPVLGTPNYWAVLGKKLTHYLDATSDNLAWLKLFNEMQMYLHQHSINREREAQGLPTVNSLWCWGADNYANEHYSNIHWYADDPLIKALGQLYTERSDAVTAFHESAPDTDKIVVMLSLLKFLKGELEQDPFTELKRLESLLAFSIRANRYRIRLHSGNGQDFEYLPMHRFKRWRRLDSLQKLIVEAGSVDEWDDT